MNKPDAVIKQKAHCGCGWKHDGEGWRDEAIKHATYTGHKVEWHGSIHIQAPLVTRTAP